MTIVLTERELKELSWLFDVHGWDVKAGARVWGAMDIIETLETMPVLVSFGLVVQNPRDERRFYITQKGADYLRENTCICTPFDTPDELTAARAEIERLTAENTALKEALSVADTGWSECISIVENLVKEEGHIVPQWVTSKDPWATAREFKRRKDDIRALYRGE